MYTKVTPKAGQNGPMWLYAGFWPILWHVAVTTSYVTFSRLVVGYITKLQARFVLVTSPFQVISRPCRWAQKLTYKVRKTRTQRPPAGPLTPGALSRWLLWGESRSLARNTAAFRRRFRLQ